jgi:choline dehydrogenase-like flavoprotein
MASNETTSSGIFMGAHYAKRVAVDQPLSIGVVGAGTAGAAAATLLARARHTVTVLERVPDPQPIGAGITLQPTDQRSDARSRISGDPGRSAEPAIKREDG